MERMKEVELTGASLKFSGQYVKDKFPKGRDIERNLVMNTTAHGFFMGARDIEKRQARPTWKFWIKKDLDEEALLMESIKASQYYVKKKSYGKVPFGQLALIKSTVAYGFREGYAYRRKIDSEEVI